jgi:NAD(P)-dependent dehydrogenase (short-subunit alcohol dehydrogenase family)
MSFDLSGRTALVTGASRGIGAGIARALDAAGARVAVSARTAEALAPVVSELTHDPVIVAGDLELAAEPARIAAQAARELGEGIDVLVCNAGVGARPALQNIDAELIDWLYAVNVRAPLLLIQAVAPGMIERGGGSIVTLSSVSGVVGTPRRSAYAATKGAVDAMTRSLAAELGPNGIRLNSVAPGVVDTDMWAQNKAVAGVVEQVNALTPLRRWAEPADIADVVVFLASDAARFVTGETICADGGMARTVDLYAGAG